MKKWGFIVLAIVIIGGGVVGYFYYKGSASLGDAALNTDTQETTTLPAGTKTVVAIVGDNATIAVFSAGLKSTLLADTLAGTGPYTVLAPTESAFKALPAGTLDTLLKVDNIAKFKNILNYHIIPGTITKSQFTNGQRIKTLNGQELIAELTDGKVIFVDAKGGKAAITKADISASNGVVHTIDAVLLPQ
jgi:uncharacterized surface protein with fasciclin (FAS1) repeats